MTRESAAAFRRITTVNWPAHQEAGAKAHLIKVARAGHARIMEQQRARAGVSPDFEYYANTHGNEILESVKLPGPIVFRYWYFREIVFEAMRFLESASPAEHGRYMRAHRLYVNGAHVPDPIEHTFRQNDEIIVVNAAPYARKIEVGRTHSGRTFTIDETQSAVYQRALERLKQRFRHLARLRFQFINLSDAYRLKLDWPTKRQTRSGVSKRVRSGRGKGAAIQYPAIIINAL